MPTKVIVILADLQIPYHDPRYVSVMAKFMDAIQPDERGQIGDLMDQPEVGRWNKGAAGEYAGSFWKNVVATRAALDQLQLNWVKLGNHDERMELYIQKYAPALHGPDSQFTLENVLNLQVSGIALHRKPFRVAPGWIAAHGHEGSLSSVAGRTAFQLAQRWDASVVCGHTHRLGTVSTTVGMPGNRRTLTGMEVGHGMLEGKATYIKSGAPNWQKGFGILIVDGRHTYGHAIAMKPDCSFMWDGRVWKP